jgi:TatD DNase family protein
MPFETLTDTHCHLDFPDYDADRATVIANAKAAGVSRLITIGTNLETSRHALKLAAQHPGVFATVGIHPNEVEETPDDAYDQLKEMAQQPGVVAIGECGLDYHYLPSKVEKKNFGAIEAATLASTGESMALTMADGANKNRQDAFFRMQLDLAADLGLNVVVHQRDSWEDCLRVLEDYRGKVRTVFHCFGGSIGQAEDLLADGHLISFTGLVTFKNAPTVQQTASQIPLHAFMVETDCPYLSPVPHRGKRCEPAFTRLVAERIAHLRGVPLATIADATEATTNQFFRFPSSP